MNQDWKPIKRGDPLFMDLLGKTKTYTGEDTIWPVFIGEVAYKEKNIAMSYTKKEVLNLPNQICKEFLGWIYYPFDEFTQFYIRIFYLRYKIPSTHYWWFWTIFIEAKLIFVLFTRLD